MSVNIVVNSLLFVLLIISNATLLSTTEGNALGLGLENLRATGHAFAAVAKQVSPSVVNIQVEQTMNAENMLRTNPHADSNADAHGLDPLGEELFRFFFSPPLTRDHPMRKQVMIGQGSGFVIKVEKGLSYIVTSSHVVKNASKVLVKLQNGAEMEAKIVGTDVHSDLAVIKVMQELPKVNVGDSEKLEVGEWVVAIGNPFGLSHTITAGIVSAKGRSGMGITDYENFIQTDAAINPGNSGGPLVDLQGQVIGINTAIVSQGGGYIGIGFAIPINMASNLVEQLITNGVVNRGYLGVGVQELTDELSKSFGLKAGLKGVLISQVVADSPADKAGLKQGDIALELDGKPVTSTIDFRNVIALSKAGSAHTILVLRDDVKKVFRFQVADQPVEKRNKVNEKEAAVIDKLGLTLKDSNEGVEIAGVMRGSLADWAGIRPGTFLAEINRKPVKNASECMRLLNRSNLENILLLLKNRDGNAWYITLSQQNAGGTKEE
jgi:serine protease Do